MKDPNSLTVALMKTVKLIFFTFSNGQLDAVKDLSIHTNIKLELPISSHVSWFVYILAIDNILFHDETKFDREVVLDTQQNVSFIRGFLNSL